MKNYKIKSHAKLNLSLNVIKKVSKNFHKIESLITFINLHDLIYIKEIKNSKHKIKFQGKFSKDIPKNNTISSLLNLLDKNGLLNKKKYEIKIIKNIPQKSGMGGGSINASSIVQFFIKKKIFKLSQKKLIYILKSIGSDVQLGIHQKNISILNNGNLKTFKRKLGLYTLLVKPSFGCSTKVIYSKTKIFTIPKYRKPNASFFSIRNIIQSNNDLENAAFEVYPKLKKIKNFLSSLPNVMCARMTGSGSCIVAYYKSKKSANKGLKLFKKKYKNYWCIISKTV